ncbi:dTDP-glucose 4,6-dehydratase [Sinorhizobium sojae CCBAU 05684]|uniref:dTDP-glucose 4,6-dehydratase n=1 Tax=Sinorhizobium sojae CCBAU 05684 TaxID=716928 RepID=A0A249PCG6_9HYPH|nr:NAD(P)-dependent oxidoreductase [Sinorhizobium sojae]ASY63465.1 dTDP-glucose 4,6-dehydratase [Sinorhizobium sojae CCBAU 05684]
MKYTVFGASGLIGGHLVRRLRELGHDVLAAPRDFAAMPDADLGHVIYAIGLTADFRSRPFDTITAHVSLTADILRAAHFCSFLYLSSTRVYGNGTQTEENASLSARPADPSDLYNLSKLTGEAICLQSGRPDVRIARLSNVVGIDEASADTFIGALCREARTGRITLQTALDSRKDYIWIGDVVDLLARIASEGTQSIYNVASGRNITHAQWVEAICGRTGCSLTVAEHAPAVSFPPISIQRIQREFQFYPADVLGYLPDILADRLRTAEKTRIDE